MFVCLHLRLLTFSHTHKYIYSPLAGSQSNFRPTYREEKKLRVEIQRFSQMYTQLSKFKYSSLCMCVCVCVFPGNYLHVHIPNRDS